MHSRRDLLAQAAAFACLASAARAQENATDPAPLGWVQRPLGHGTAIVLYPAADSVARTLAPAPPPPSGHGDNLTRRFGAATAEILLHGRGYAQPGAQAATGEFPVLLFAPGSRLAAFDYRVLLERVVGAGYVVVALTPPAQATYSDVATELAAAIAAIDGWRERADDALGAICGESFASFGHSLGGAASVLTISRSPRLRAAANLDGDFAPPTDAARPHQPLLYMLQENASEPQRSRDRRRRAWANVSSRSTSATALRCDGFRHLTFLDASLIAQTIPANLRANRFGDVNAQQALDATALVVTAFFDEHLKGRSDALATVAAATNMMRPY